MIRIGFIGLGRMGNSHAKNLITLPDVAFTQAYDINPQKNEAFKTLYPQVNIVSSPLEVISAPDVDFILIATPTYCHDEALIPALKSGKPVFCEKPLCRTRPQLEQLTVALKERTNNFSVGFVRRYSNATRLFKKLFDEGKIGTPKIVSVRVLFGGFVRQWGDWFTEYEKSGGCILDMMAHHCDLMNMLFGLPHTVYTQSTRLNKKETLPFDYLSSTSTYSNGVICNMECTWMRSGPSLVEMVVTGDKGTLRLSDKQGVEFFDIGAKEPEVFTNKEGIAGALNEKITGGMYKVEMAEIIDAAKRGKDDTAAGAQQAIDAMKFGLAMLESAETGKIITL